jgi:uncharacterized membrane protein
MVKKNSVIFLLLFATIFSGIGLLHPGFPPTHDGEYHIIRFYEFDNVLRSGVLYPRWAPDLNNGYGIPLFNFVYPLPNYIASILHFFGFSFIDGFKVSLLLSIFVAATGMYIFAKEYWGSWGGIVSAFFYSFSPYHLVDIYIRGSIGEAWALAIFPFYLWSLYKLFQKKQRKYISISSLLLALLIFSHNILALMFFGFSLFYIFLLLLYSYNKKQSIFHVFLVVVLGLSLSAMFWLPALLEKQYTTGLDIYNVTTSFPDLFDLLIPSWGSGFSSSDLGNRMSLQIGVANLIAIFLVITFLFFKKKVKIDKKVLLFFISWFFIVFFVMLKVSSLIWTYIPLMNYFQFAWRLLSLEIFITSFLAGSLLIFFPLKVLKLILLIVPILFTYNYLFPAYYHQRNDWYYISRSNFIDGTNSPGNYFNTIWFNKNLPKSSNKIKSNEKITVKKVTSTSQQYDILLNAKETTNVIANIAYFPGWKVTVEKQNIKTNKTKDGLLEFSVPKGQHNLSLIFSDTVIRRISSIISVISLLLIIALLRSASYVKIKR